MSLPRSSVRLWMAARAPKFPWLQSAKLIIKTTTYKNEAPIKSISVIWAMKPRMIVIVITKWISPSADTSHLQEWILAWHRFSSRSASGPSHLQIQCRKLVVKIRALSGHKRTRSTRPNPKVSIINWSSRIQWFRAVCIVVKIVTLIQSPKHRNQRSPWPV